MRSIICRITLVNHPLHRILKLLLCPSRPLQHTNSPPPSKQNTCYSLHLLHCRSAIPNTSNCPLNWAPPIRVLIRAPYNGPFPDKSRVGISVFSWSGAAAYLLFGLCGHDFQVRCCRIQENAAQLF